MIDSLTKAFNLFVTTLWSGWIRYMYVCKYSSLQHDNLSISRRTKIRARAGNTHIQNPCDDWSVGAYGWFWHCNLSHLTKLCWSLDDLSFNSSIVMSSVKRGRLPIWDMKQLCLALLPSFMLTPAWCLNHRSKCTEIVFLIVMRSASDVSYWRLSLKFLAIIEVARVMSTPTATSCVHDCRNLPLI